MNLVKMQTIVVPHALKVAFFVSLSAGLTYLLNNLGQLHLNEVWSFIVMGLINVALAGVKKYTDQ